MITFFAGKIEDVFVSEYTKKETGEVVVQYEVTATFKKRSSKGKLFMYTHHFRFTLDQVAGRLDDAVGKYILVPFEKRQFGQTVSFSQNYDLGFEVLDTNPFEVSKPEPKIGKKAS